jgi:hypothetical protein
VYTDLSLPTTPRDRSLLCHRISLLMVALLAQVQRAAPQSLRRPLAPLEQLSQRQLLCQKLAQLLQQTPEGVSLQRAVVKILQHWLVSAFFQTAAYRQLLWQIQQQFEPARSQSNLPPMAVLLLDADNVPLSADLEAWLAGHCPYPIQLKLAFGNWRKLGRRDLDFHRRDYQLLHVPPGKNGADFKMTALGSLLPRYAGHIKAAIICSSDSDFGTLRQILAAQGLRVYQLRRSPTTLILSDSHSADWITLAVPTEGPMPDLVSGIRFLQAHLAIAAQPVELTALCWTFEAHFKVALRTFVQHHRGGANPKLFLQSRSEFTVALAASSLQIEVSLAAAAAKTAAASSFFSGPEVAVVLENTLVGLLEKLCAQQEIATVPLDRLSAAFYEQFGQSLKRTLAQNSLGSSLPKFFRSCPKLQISWNGQQWMLAAAEADASLASCLTSEAPSL